jgi:6-phosphogluconolactonase (cycloisomerase 2 family)
MSKYASFVLPLSQEATFHKSMFQRFTLNHLTLIGFTLFLATTAFATPTVTVISPQLSPFGTATGGPRIFYEAYATSPGCAKGVSAMRIYSAPGVVAYTVNGDHIETFLALRRGNHNTVVQAWDHCGGVAKASVPVDVTGDNLSVYLPNAPLAYSPVHVAASAFSLCPGGFSAMRLYTGPGVSPYTVNSNQLDTYVSLPPGNYNMTVQAWDNCGHVFKSQLTNAVSASADRYLYGTYHQSSTKIDSIAKLEVGATGNLINPNGGADPPQFPAANASSVAVDPGGWFLYASQPKGIYGFQINPADGSLLPIPGSPFPASGTTRVVMDPSGNFLYGISGSIATYRIDRSSGALTATGNSVSLTTPHFNTSVTGPYFYVLRIFANQLVGYNLNANNGALTQIPGLPITIDNNNLNGLGAGGYRLYAGANFDGEAYGYNINPGNGALTPMTGSPFPLSTNTSFLWIDWEGRYLWPWFTDPTGTDNSVATYDINPNGSLTSTGYAVPAAYPAAFESFTEDLTGNFVFAFWTDAELLPVKPPLPKARVDADNPQVGVNTFFISEGDLVPASHIVLPKEFDIGAVSRQNPN